MFQQIHNKAAPFIKWLKEAEEESGSEDESDEESEPEVWYFLHQILDSLLM